MQEIVVNATLKHLKESGFNVAVSFPDKPFKDYVITVSPVMFRDVPLKGVLDVQKDLDRALISKAVSGAEVTLQIDIYARKSLIRDRLVDQVRKALKNFPSPTPEQPVLFLRISDARSLDTPDFYRTVLSVDFQVYDVVSEDVPIVKEISSSVREV